MSGAHQSSNSKVRSYWPDNSEIISAHSMITQPDSPQKLEEKMIECLVIHLPNDEIIYTPQLLELVRGERLEHRTLETTKNWTLLVIQQQIQSWLNNLRDTKCGDDHFLLYTVTSVIMYDLAEAYMPLNYSMTQFTSWGALLSYTDRSELLS